MKRQTIKSPVTCGDCGHLQLADNEEEEIQCDKCGFISEPCDFPDYPDYSYL